MTFVARMAWRDSRASRRGLFLSSLSVVCGIAALVALGSFGEGLAGALGNQTKALLGADLVVISRQPFAPAVERYVESLGGQAAREVAFSSMMVFPGANGATRLVQVRAGDGRFPLYGEAATEPSGALAVLRKSGPVSGAVLERTLMSQFGLRMGDRVRLGRTEFRIAGALDKIPGESLAVALLAPRAFIPLESLADAGLTGEGSLVSHRLALRLPRGTDPEAVVRDMKARFSSERLSFDTVAGRKRELGKTLANVDSFLSLVGFIALLLGAIGVASAVHVYVRQKLATVALLRCLGASARRGFGVYLLQGVVLGLVGACAGGALGIGVQVALPSLFKGLLPFPIGFSIAWPAVARGMGAGLAICILFTLLPLLAIRKVSPLGALRAAFAEKSSSPDAVRVAVGVLIGVAVAAFAIWQTRSLRIGLGFAAALGLAFGLLSGLAWLVASAARRWSPRSLPYVARQGIANLHRPNNRTVLLLLSLGLGTFLILTLVLVRTSLLREIEGVGAGGQPNLLFFDIQDDQVHAIDALLASRGSPPLREAVVVTMRISALRGVPVEDFLGRSGARVPAWTLRREYRSTYRGSPLPTEKIVSGHFVGRVDPGTAVVPISVEEGLAKDMGLTLGDAIDWDVQGVPIRTRVASLRAVEWRRLEPNFFVVFPEGVLEDAPKFHMAAVRAATPEASSRLQSAVAQAFPNVTAIDLTLILATVDAIVGKVLFAVEFMALFTVATGAIVLAGAVFSGRHQRRREAALLRVLGASRRQLSQIQSIEYAVLGVLAAAVGGILALAAAALLAIAVFHSPPVASPLVFLAGIACVSAFTLLSGWLADRGTARHPPLETLRAEGV